MYWKHILSEYNTKKCVLLFWFEMRLSKQKIKLYPQEIVVVGGTLLCKRHKNVETQTVKKN